MKKQKTILVVDDEAPMRRNVSEILQHKGYNVKEAADGIEALEILKNFKPNLVLLDINMPKMDGLTVNKEIKKMYPDLPVIIFTAFSTSENIINAMKTGAYDYIEKPFDLNEFSLIVSRAINHDELLGEIEDLKSQIETERKKEIEEEFIGKSQAITEIFKLIGRIAPTDATVLITGESGTGKEIIANAIQRHSLRKDKPFIKVNCGALPETLLESEIFGHEKGSFTGAIAQRQGRFELANGGTIFLDEINNMPVSLQIRLLRVLQYHTFERIGGKETLTTDVRIIASSNKNMEEEVKSGRFREDLYYRLNVVKINIPPLRERPEDIPLLVNHFIKKYSEKKNILITPETLRELQSYEWTGNVRELENVIHSMILMNQGEKITSEHLPKKINPDYTQSTFIEKIKQGKSYHEIVAEIEKAIIQYALKETGMNQTKAAQLLKINRRLLYSKIKEFNINF